MTSCGKALRAETSWADILIETGYPARFALRVYYTVKVVFLPLPPDCLTAASWMPDGVVDVIRGLFTARLLLSDEHGTTRVHAAKGIETSN
ncbi:MAG: hypothetical protein ACJ8CB_18290 [Ktedonobacteraceae bacterium]